MRARKSLIRAILAVITMPGLVFGIGFSSWITVSSQEIKSYTALSLLCYRLGIRRKRAVDADLDIHGDERW